MENEKKEKKDKKRTIHKTFKDDPSLGGFCGWDKIKYVLDGLTGDDLKIFVGLFSLGARSGELCRIQTQQIHLDYSPDQIECRGFFVSKWRKSIGHRTFHINKSEPIYPYLEDIVSRTPDNSLLFDFSYNKIYYAIAKIEATPIPRETLSPDECRAMGIPIRLSGLKLNKEHWAYFKGPWWPHRIRAERCCQLIRDYGLPTFALKKWFGWRTNKMPGFYGDMTAEDVARLMLKPQITLEVTPQLLSELDDNQRKFILELLQER